MQYLHDVDYAWKITEETVRMFSKHDVTTLVESSVTNEKELATVTRLMAFSKDAKHTANTPAAHCLQPGGSSSVQEPGSSTGLESVTAKDEAHQQGLKKVQSNHEDVRVITATAACTPGEDKPRQQKSRQQRRQKRSLPS